MIGAILAAAVTIVLAVVLLVLECSRSRRLESLEHVLADLTRESQRAYSQAQSEIALFEQELATSASQIAALRRSCTPSILEEHLGVLSRTAIYKYRKTTAYKIRFIGTEAIDVFLQKNRVIVSRKRTDLPLRASGSIAILISKGGEYLSPEIKSELLRSLDADMLVIADADRYLKAQEDEHGLMLAV